MLCPLKFGHYEFEGGQNCIGSECGMFKRCNVGSAFVAGNAKQATVDANDAPPEGTFQVSHNCGSTFSPPAKIRGEQDSSDSRIRKGLGYKDVPPHEPSEATKRFIEELDSELDSSEKLEADALALVDNLRVYGCNYAGDAEVEIIGMLDRQAAITDSECRSEFNVLDEHAQALERENAKLRKLCGANDALAAENGVSEAGVDANDGNAMQDSRGKLEADAHSLVAAFTDTYSDESELFGKVIRLLDRQAAITERECFERSVFDLGAHKRIIEQDRTIVEYADKNAELQAKVDELTEQLETAHAKNRSLRQHIAKMQEGRHGWHVKGAELQKQVYELTAELEAARNAHAQAEHEAVILREKLGRALDYAHEITSVGGDC